MIPLLVLAFVPSFSDLQPSAPVQDRQPLAARADALDPERLLRALPGNALFALKLDGIDELRAEFPKSAWVQLAHDPAVWPYVEKLSHTLQGEFARERAELPAEVQKLTDPCAWLSAVHGGLALHGQRTADGSGVAAGLLVELREPRAALQDLIAGGLALLSKEADTSTADYAGVSLALYTEPLEGPNDVPDCVVHFESAGVAGFAIGDGREAALQVAQSMVDGLAGNAVAGGLLSSARFQSARAGSVRMPGLELYVDLGQVWSLIEHEQAEEGVSTQSKSEDDRIVEAIGLHGLQWAHLTAGLGSGEALETSLAVSLPSAGALASLGQLLTPVSTKWLARMPADSTSVALVRLDFNGLWKLIQDTVREVDPGTFEQMRAVVEGGIQSSGLDFEKDLLAQLDGEMATFSLTVPESERNAELESAFTSLGMGEGGVFLLGLREIDPVESLLERALELTGMASDLESTEYAGHWINSLQAGPLTIHWCFADKAVLVSTSPSSLRASLDLLPGAAPAGSTTAAPRSAAQNPLYANAFAMHADHAAVTVQDTGALARGLLRFPALLQLLPEISADAHDGGLLGELLALPAPDPESVAGKYFKGTLLTTFGVRDGALRIRYAGH